MSEYRDVIERQVKLQHKSNSWWPKYFYHFTDIRNAMGIIELGWIYGRNNVLENNLMKNDNASESVITISKNKVKDCARLYFRPRTPTQYNNEGYKPTKIRRKDLNASCPVPIFFFLDSETVLNMENVKFSEVSCAGLADLNLLSGAEAFEKLPFDKIYHDKYIPDGSRSDIVKHRHAEILGEGGIPISKALRGIVCRSVAEKQTLLYLLRKKLPEKYKEYRKIIRYLPKLNLFFNNGIYINRVEYQDNSLIIFFNDASKRVRGDCERIGVNVRIELYYLDDLGFISEHDVFRGKIDYHSCEEINIELGHKYSDEAILEIYFDDILMYKNEIWLEQDLLF